jgi:hypothetical protein
MNLKLSNATIAGIGVNLGQIWSGEGMLGTANQSHQHEDE